jgi:hypothetical protein
LIRNGTSGGILSLRHSCPSSSRESSRSGEVTFKEPKVEGIPFNADNMIKAATLTYPTDMRGNRISLAQRALNDEGYVHFGITELEREIHGGGVNEAPGAKDTGQMQIDFGEPPPPEDDSLMRPADAATVASHDYYYQALLKSGVIKGAQVVAPKPPAATAAPQASQEPTPTGERNRIAKGAFNDQDVIETGIFGMYPVPDPRRVEV